MKSRSIIALLASASAAAASWAGNLNYRSPSEHHPSLGIAIHKVARRGDPDTPHDPADLKFTHGVASGDPYADSVILWTRAAPTSETDRSNITVTGNVGLFTHENEAFVKQSKNPICVQWRISESEEFESVVNEGTIYTSSDIDYTVKVFENANTRQESVADDIGNRSRRLVYSRSRNTTTSSTFATQTLKVHWEGPRRRPAQTMTLRN